MSVSSWPSLAMWRNNLCPACGTTFGSEPDCRLRNFVVPCHSGFPGPKQGGLFVAMSFFFRKERATELLFSRWKTSSFFSSEKDSSANDANGWDSAFKDSMWRQIYVATKRCGKLQRKMDLQVSRKLKASAQWKLSPWPTVMHPGCCAIMRNVSALAMALRNL